jgi:hypothetical protein
MEQLVARWTHNPEVTGSSPFPATKHPVGVVRFLIFHTTKAGFYPLFYSFT